jgi:hypothetical protein
MGHFYTLLIFVCTSLVMVRIRSSVTYSNCDTTSKSDAENQFDKDYKHKNAILRNIVHVNCERSLDGIAYENLPGVINCSEVQNMYALNYANKHQEFQRHQSLLYEYEYTRCTGINVFPVIIYWLLFFFVVYAFAVQWNFQKACTTFTFLYSTGVCTFWWYKLNFP